MRKTDPVQPQSGPEQAGPDPGFLLTLPLRGRKVLVVGGGTAAAQMVTALRSAGALVRVVAPTLNRPLSELAAQGLIEIANRQYQARDLAEAWLAFACSDHRSVNAALAFDAEQARIWCVTPQDSPPPVAAAPVARAETPVREEPSRSGPADACSYWVAPAQASQPRPRRCWTATKRSST